MTPVLGGVAVSCELNFPEKEKRIVLISLILGRELLGSISDALSPSHFANTISEKQKVSYSIVQKSKAILRKFNPIAVQLIWRNKQENFKRNTSSANHGNFLLPICEGNEHSYQAGSD